MRVWEGLILGGGWWGDECMKRMFLRPRCVFGDVDVSLSCAAHLE